MTLLCGADANAGTPGCAPVPKSRWRDASVEGPPSPPSALVAPSGSLEQSPEQAPSLLGSLMLTALRFYRRRLSPLKGAPSCRYLPTCSEYAMQAVRRHGAAKGAALAAARILRCNPFFHAGYHPVPEAGSWAACEHEGPH